MTGGCCWWFLGLPLRFQMGVVSISLCGTRRLSRLVSFVKLWTFSLAISASSSGVISLRTTVSLHSGLTLTPLLPFAWYDTLFLKNPFPTNASAVYTTFIKLSLNWINYYIVIIIIIITNDKAICIECMIVCGISSGWVDHLHKSIIKIYILSGCVSFYYNFYKINIFFIWMY